MPIKSAPLTDLVRILGRRFMDDRCAQIASSLTFTTLLSLVPIITVALTVVSAFPVFASLLDHLQRFLVSNLVPESAAVIATYATSFSENAARLTTVGVAFLGVTALMLMFTIDNAFNHIWRVRHPRRLLQRVLVYWTALTLGPVFVGASLSLTSYLVRLSLGLIDNPPGMGVLLLRVVSLSLTSIALALLYAVVPNRQVLKRDALIGGIAAGICLEAMKQGFSFYIAHFPSYTLVYGAFAAVPVFLLWIYLSWLIVVAGAVLAAVMPEWRERAGMSRPVPGSDFFDALQVLKMLWHAHKIGDVTTLTQLYPAVKVRPDHLEAILNTLVGAGWVASSGATGWVLARDVSAVRVEDVYRQFVFRSDARVPARHADPDLEVLAHDISVRIAGNLGMSLVELFERAEREAADAAAPSGLKLA